jgi:arylsulfatase A-like enzyme
VDAPVSIIDVVPTLLALSREGDEDERWDGSSLLPHILGEEGPGERDIFGEVSYRFDSPPHDTKTSFKTSLLSKDWKLIHDLATDRWEIYDLESDPVELHDLIENETTAAAELRRRLLSWEESRTRGRPSSGEPRRFEPSAADIGRLKRLGYLR